MTMRRSSSWSSRVYSITLPTISLVDDEYEGKVPWNPSHEQPVCQSLLLITQQDSIDNHDHITTVTV